MRRLMIALTLLSLGLASFAAAVETQNFGSLKTRFN